MKNIILALSLIVASAAIADSDITANEINLLKKITGEYKNRLGDSAGVELEFSEEDPEQPSLFGPEIVDFGITFSLHDGDYYEFDVDDMDRSESDDSSVFFSKSINDCDNPGCTNYEIQLEFIKKRNGGYYIAFEGNFSTDAEDIAADVEYYEGFSDLSKEEQESYVDKACKETYGETAYLEYLHELSNGFYNVYCAYSVTRYVTK